MNVRFFPKYVKKTNSTMRPISSYQGALVLDCKLLDNVSVVSPILLVEQPANVNMLIYNYCYIEDFGRYYFVSNMVHTGSLYTIYLAGDVLASFRTSILGSTQYVVRSSILSDENIVDTMYVTKPFSTLTTRTAVSTYSNATVTRSIVSGGEPATGSVVYFAKGNIYPTAAVCFGVIGAGGVGANYYVCTESNFITFMQNVCTFIPSDMGSLADGVKKSLLGLADYIVSVVRLPVMPHSSNLGAQQTSVQLGSYSISCDCYSFDAGIHYEEYELGNEITLPVHPNASTHSYYKMPPYTSYVLDFLPLGSVPLDASKLYGSNWITIKWSIDYISGLAWFKVGYYASANNFVTLFTDIAQVGIPIPLSQLKVDNQTGIGLSIASAVNTALKNKSGYTPKISGDGQTYTGTQSKNPFIQVGSKWLQSAKDLIGGVANAIQGNTGINNIIEVGNFIDTNTDILDQIIDYAGNILGDMTTKGSTGSYLNLIAGPPSVRAFFIDQAENDNARFGSPLYQKKVLRDLVGGFCVCKNAMVPSFAIETCPPVLSEVQAIISLLNSGVYLET